MERGKAGSLTEEERATYEWQMWVPGFGEHGQKALKAASVLVSRCGGVGGVAAYQLAAAGIGRLVLAHGGTLKHSDLNRQILMTHDWVGKPRVESAARRLRELNPRLAVEAVAENVTEANAERLVAQADVVVCCAPLFQERLLMNREAVRRRKPLVDCAMYELQAQITCMIPGQTACLACLYSESPHGWKRQFPVFGAVAGMIGALGAMEAIKLIAGLGKPLAGRMLMFDLRDGTVRQAATSRDPKCPVCGGC
ncbi:MAG: HesA/MoeB/ThiF family protein [Planctomycetota bacterium]|nr:HesA/MoeB/ThiF family protein [Planctomycetota bacterium]